MSPELEKATQEEGATSGANENKQEDDEGRVIYPYERLTTTAEDPAPDIDVTKREVIDLSSTFRSHAFLRSNDDAIYCYQLNADLLIVSRVQRQIQHDKGRVLQASQVEAEQIEVLCPTFLACPRLSRLLKTITVCQKWGHRFLRLDLMSSPAYHILSDSSYSSCLQDLRFI